MNNLRKSNTNKIISGICGGIGQALNIDPTIIRILFILFFFNNILTGALVYFLLNYILPEDDFDYYESNDGFDGDYQYKASPSSPKNSNMVLGLLLIGVAAVLLAQTFIPNLFYRIRKFWPVGLILLGLYLIYKSNDEK